MVGHQSVVMKRAAGFVKRLAQPVQVSGVVFLAEAAGRSVVPTLRDVQGNIVQMNSGASGHARHLSEYLSLDPLTISNLLVALRATYEQNVHSNACGFAW